MRNRLLVGLVPVVAALSGCGTPAESTTPSVTVTETVTATATETVTATVTATPTEGSAGADGTSSAEVTLPPSSRPLGLEDFFNPDEEWEEGRWNVANRSQEQGVSTAFSYGEPLLELRLQNQFSTLAFDAAQANDSETSECLTTVDVTVDGELRETHEFAFNTIQEFTGIDVRDGNAVKIAASAPECSDSVRIVLSNIQLE